MRKILFILLIVLAASPVLQAQCTCGATPTENRWGNVELKINRSGALKKIVCGYQFNISCKDTVWFLSGRYNCIGPCSAKYKAKLSKGAAIVRTFDHFSFSTEFLSFRTPGVYKLEILATCNNALCKTCSFYFTVRDEGCAR
jgi:hypothetical protein